MLKAGPWGCSIKHRPAEIQRWRAAPGAIVLPERLHRFIAASALILALTTLAAAPQTAAQPTEQRLQRLEEQVKDLTGRIEALERGTLASPATEAVPSSTDGPTWAFESPLDGTEMSVIHYVLDTKTGIMELLLRIETPLEDKAAWSQTGSDTPIIALVDDGEGSPTRATFRLLRGRRLDPGASLHLQARIPVATASKAGHVRVQSAPDH